MYIFRGKNISEIVNDKEWQALRKSMLGTWKTQKAKNLKTFRKYLGDMTDELKMARVLNYLSSSAFRVGIIKGEDIEDLREELKRKLYPSRYER